MASSAGGLNHAIGGFASIVLAAQQGGIWPRFKLRGVPLGALRDRTKNRSAAWCASQCGARVRVRRYRKRRRQEST